MSQPSVIASLLLALLVDLLVLPSVPARPTGQGERDPLLQEKGKKKGGDDKKGGGDKKGSPKEDGKGKSEPNQAPGRDLEAWGTLKEVKGTPFHTLDYAKIDGRKATKHSAFVKIADDAEFYTDKSIKVTDLKEGDTVWLLGRPVENEAPSASGVTGIDRQFQNVLAIVAGDGLRVHRRYKDPRDPKVLWCEATIAKPGPAISVKYEGNNFKVVLGKTASVLQREKAGDAKAVKSGAQVEISAEKSDEKPETKSATDAKKESFTARKVVLLDKRFVGTLYPMLLE